MANFNSFINTPVSYIQSLKEDHRVTFIQEFANWDGTGSSTTQAANMIYKLTKEPLISGDWQKYKNVLLTALTLLWELPVTVELNHDESALAFKLLEALQPAPEPAEQEFKEEEQQGAWSSTFTWHQNTIKAPSLVALALKRATLPISREERREMFDQIPQFSELPAAATNNAAKVPQDDFRKKQWSTDITNVQRLLTHTLNTADEISNEDQATNILTVLTLLEVTKLSITEHRMTTVAKDAVEPHYPVLFDKDALKLIQQHKQLDKNINQKQTKPTYSFRSQNQPWKRKTSNYKGRNFNPNYRRDFRANFNTKQQKSKDTHEP